MSRYRRLAIMLALLPYPADTSCRRSSAHHDCSSKHPVQLCYSAPCRPHHLDPSRLRHGGRVPEEEELAAVADDQAAAVARDAPPLPRLCPAATHPIDRYRPCVERGGRGRRTGRGRSVGGGGLGGAMRALFFSSHASNRLYAPYVSSLIDASGNLYIYTGDWAGLLHPYSYFYARTK